MLRGDFEDSRLMAALKVNNRFQQLEASDRYEDLLSKEKSQSQQEQFKDDQLREIIDNLAQKAIMNSQPLLAASYHLSLNDPESAVVKLLRANEILYALAICKIFELDSLFDTVAFQIAKRCERYSERNTG
mmetsp:Transcript_38131/g.34086  ORF Transcript_38131/g.34086 Transcript_38131/m.34086 type:complete len:131 (+) Transcript_38131:82-474(+)